jgi:NitT/TauT family transport system substrate-binding protein
VRETRRFDSARRPLTRRTLLKGSAAAFAAAGTAPLLSACGGRGGEADDSALTFLTILPMTTLTFAPEFLADAGGYFAGQGLEVSFQSTRGSAQAVQLVIAGSAPLTRVGQIEAVSHAANRDAPIMNVGTVMKQSTLRFISSERAPIREPRDFLGKLMGISSEGGETEITMDLLLASSGIDPAEVERQVVGVGPGVYNLVEQGRIAGFIVSIDTAIILERQTPGVVVLNPSDFIQSGAQFYMAAAGDLERQREPIRRYLEAIRAAIDFMIADDGFDETLRIMRQRYSFGTLDDEEVAKASLAEYARLWTAEGRENILRTVPESWRRGYEELASAGRAAGGKAPEQWFTNALVPAR